MSLIITQPFRSDFVNRFPHEFSPGKSLVKSQSSPNTRRTTPSLESSLQVSEIPAYENMTTPHTHRGLPPMNLPDLNRPGPPSLTQPLGAMPAPPFQWQGQEDSMRNWLLAKAEEDKRKQEEERTRQESLKLEQRKIEQSMLRESLQGGIPPTMVPMIYAGMSGGSLANVSVDWLQQYTSQLQLQQQQLQHSSPDMHRGEGRLIGPLGSNPYPLTQPAQPAQQQYSAPQPAQHQVLQSHVSEQQPQPPPPAPIQATFSAYQPPTARQPPTSDPRSATRTQLPRLTTNEMYVQPPPVPASVHPLQQSQTVQQQAQQPASSPSIYFHHWVPPNESRSSNQPQTPAAKPDSQHSSHPSASNVGEIEHRESPRKRKAQGAHQANPPPSAGPQYTSPSFSTTSSASGRKGGNRSRAFSNVSAIGRDTDSRQSSRPSSSHRRDDIPPQRSSHLSESGQASQGGQHNGADDLLRSTERALEEKPALPPPPPHAPAPFDGRESEGSPVHRRTRSR